jgi:23S rRNA-/tRNA-specific pseudouridylate synthase
MTLRVVFASTEEVVVDKPAGVAAEVTHGRSADSAIERIRRDDLVWSADAEAARGRVELGDASLVHRLDKPTRGLLVAGLTPGALAHHGEQIRERRWRKFYVARLAMPSDPRELLGEHKGYVKRVGRRAELVRSGGKPAFMDVLAIEPAPGRAGEAHALIELRTGRFHQIRVLLAAREAALIGDELYGGAAGSMFLEHVLLLFTPTGAAAPAVVYQRDAPGRERLSEAIENRLGEIERALRVDPTAAFTPA